MSGFPARPDRAAFGPNMVNAAPVRDPSRQLDAAQLNLLSHQAAGLGLIAPRVMLRLTVHGTTPVLLSRAEAWNPKGLTSGQYVDPILVGVSTGRMTVQYPTVIADQLGQDIGIGFLWGLGFHADDPPTTLKHVRVAPVAATPNIVTVTAFDDGGVLEDGVDATILLW